MEDNKGWAYILGSTPSCSAIVVNNLLRQDFRDPLTWSLYALIMSEVDFDLIGIQKYNQSPITTIETYLIGS